MCPLLENRKLQEIQNVQMVDRLYVLDLKKCNLNIYVFLNSYWELDKLEE